MWTLSFPIGIPIPGIGNFPISIPIGCTRLLPTRTTSNWSSRRLQEVTGCLYSSFSVGRGPNGVYVGSKGSCKMKRVFRGKVTTPSLLF